eukprot:gene13185-17668_t
MRRSLAPSTVRNSISISSSDDRNNNKTKIPNNDENEVTIRRLPLFGFLEIPDNLSKQFKIPSGNLELRKVKSLGPAKLTSCLKPGQLGVFVRPTIATEEQQDENEEEQLPKANLPPFVPLILWQDPNDELQKVEVIPELACKLRPHQREGVQFLFECTMGLRGYEGEGCILADDMGLGKTLMSITLMWTLLNIPSNSVSITTRDVRKAMIVCPTSLVGNWDNEIRKWVGNNCPTFAVKSDPKKMIASFLHHRGKGVLIISYETQRLYSKLFEKAKSDNYCDLLICDEAHKLKNADSGLSKSLNHLPTKKRILLSGTPMQNELTEFYNMVNFCNPLILGTLPEFRRRYERPILASREPDASDSEIRDATQLQKELSTIVNEFILKRGNILNAQHLPPKLVQFVCCRLTSVQEAMYQRLLESKEIRHVREGKQTNTLNSIRQLINICSHPQIILESYKSKVSAKEAIDDDLAAIVELIPNNHSKSISNNSNYNRMHSLGSIKPNNNSNNNNERLDPELSGKMLVLYRMMQTMRALKNGERIVIVSNYTQTLDLIEKMCTQNNWPTLRLDGSVSATKRTKIVDDFNNPMSGAFAFLLSSKAGGCGINLIGGNRLVLFDPDWNPASDKQAAARIWREGQKRRCYIYRFMSTGTIEEKIIQRQLAKEGLADIVDDKDQVNIFSTSELKQLFSLQTTRSDTHDTLRCKRCSFVQIKDYSKMRETKLLQPHQVELCIQYLDDLVAYLEEVSIDHQTRNQMKVTSEVLDSNHDFKTNFPFLSQLLLLKSQLLSGEFTSLPLYSKKQREIFLTIEQEINYAREVVRSLNLNNSNNNNNELSNEIELSKQLASYFPLSFNISSTFLSRWTAIVPTLTASKYNNSNNNNKINNDENDDEIINENVDQEGCPEEADFNRWSHHVSVLTCDDELLKTALGDDSTVSFVLEINWDLLQQRELEQKEENELRKLQAKNELDALNMKRQRAKSSNESLLLIVDQLEDQQNNSPNNNNEKVLKINKKSKKKIKSVNELDEINDNTHHNKLLYVNNNNNKIEKQNNNKNNEKRKQNQSEIIELIESDHSQSCYFNDTNQFNFKENIENCVNNNNNSNNINNNKKNNFDNNDKSHVDISVISSVKRRRLTVIDSDDDDINMIISNRNNSNNSNNSNKVDMKNGSIIGLPQCDDYE